MSGYTDSEKVQYALKTALSRTMQTAMSDSAGAERSAPMRIFPSNIMKVDIIEKGKGDIDEDGNYITGHKNAGTAADMSNPEDTVKNYKIICPVNNVVTSITISSLVSYGSSTLSFINGRDTTGTNYPLKQWFYRGHLSGTGESAFGQANTNYHGLQLAWNSVADGSTPSDDNTVPHLKYYLQVQTVYTGVSNSAALDNITYEHTLLKGLIGLDSNFISTIMVAQGEGGPSSSASLGTSGSEAGDYWFTQATAGILSFYGVTNKVDSGTDLNTANFATKFPMISFVRYIGETGFGAGSGGGGGSVSLASADSNVSNMIGGTPQTMTTTTFNFDGNVGIGTTSPSTILQIKGNGDSNNVQLLIENESYDKGIQFQYKSVTGTTYDFPQAKIWTSEASAYDTKLHFSTAKGSSSSNTVLSTVMTLDDDGNVGIGTTSPDDKLHIKGGNLRIENSGSDSLDSKIIFEETGYNDRFFIATDLQNVPAGNQHLRFGYTNGGDSGITNSNVLLNIAGNGNVGIGTTSPQSQLQIGDFTGTPHITLAGANTNIASSGIYFAENDEGANPINYGMGIQFDSQNNILNIIGDENGDGTTDKWMTIKRQNGNVGIGTTDPQSHLHLAGAGDVVLRIQADTNNSDEGDNPMIEFRQDGNLLTGLIGTGNLPTGAGTNDNALYLQHCGSTGIVFLSGPSQNTQSTSVERMRITPSGNVGIGTTSPGAKLEIETSNTTFTGSLKSIHTNRSEWITMGYGGISTGTSHSLRFGVNNSEKMRIDNAGNVGIGTTSPYAKLEINGGTYTGDPTNHVAYHLRLVQEYSSDFASAGHEGGVGMQFLVDNQNQNYWPIGEIYFYCSNNDNSETDGSLRFRVSNNNDTSGSASDRANVDAMTIHHTGRVGIGTTTPGFPLEISGDVTGPYIGQVGYTHRTGHTTTASANNDPISLKTSNVIWSQGYVLASSDTRIKENIVDVSDNLALEMVRNIPVKYYEYKDKLIKGNEKTIGFIAQEVKEIIPIAVSIQKNIIPNEMRNLENISWEEIKDNSDNIINYKLTTDLSNCSGIKYRFYVTNDICGNEYMDEIVGNSDNTFTFDTSYNTVFCYGKEVDDFHTLDKQKLFTLNFSATQELDKKVIALENENAELKTKVATLESELAAIKQHLGI
jgi:hypothetical protein